MGIDELTGMFFDASADKVCKLNGMDNIIFFNIGMGLGAAMVFIAALVLSVGLTMLLLPASFIKGKLAGNKRYIAGSVFMVLAFVIMGITYFSNGGFPDVNLLFV